MGAPLDLDAALANAKPDPLWSTAQPDWHDRILNRRSLVPTLPLDPALADRAERVFNRLRIPDIVGRPTFGEAGGQWFVDIVRALFGSYDAENDVRRIQEVFLMVPKKNAKTTNAAGLMLTALILNPVTFASGLLIAPTKKIAEEAFSSAMGMIRSDPELVKKFHIQTHTKRITDRESGAHLEIKAADTDSVTGSKARYTLIDEVHVFGKHPRAEQVFVEIRGALAAAPGGFLFMITTQSKEPPTGVFKQELTRARDVRDGKRALPLLPVLYELPEEMQRPPEDGSPAAWRDPRSFALVNPNLGRSTSVQFLVDRLNDAEAEGPESLALFASQHLNVQVGVGLTEDGWAGAKHWIKGERGGPRSLAELLDRCEVVTGGGDGGGLDDLLGQAFVGRERETKRWLAWCHAFVSPIGLERRRENEPRYRDFEREGSLTVVEGLPLDLEAFASNAEMALQSGLLAQIGVDPAGVGLIVDALAGVDITQENGLLIGVAQGIRLMGAAKTLERKLVDASFLHDGSELMRWCVGNVKTRATSTAMMVERAASGYGKIDPFVALLNAAHLMGLNPVPTRPRSIWEDADIDSDEAGTGSARAWDQAILDNPRHPEWAAHKAAFEAHLDHIYGVED